MQKGSKMEILIETERLIKEGEGRDDLHGNF